MYQGGCGDLSLWGKKIIEGEQGCKIWTNNGKDVHVGSCSVAGHCVDSNQMMSYNNPYCQAAVLRQNRTQAHTNNTSLVNIQSHIKVGIPIISFNFSVASIEVTLLYSL